jgi:hypothetical protein
MKINTLTKAATSALFLIAWLLLPQTGHCFYNPSTGRWLSRDPLGERIGGKNLFLFVANEPLSRTDSLGLFVFGNPAFCWECRCKKVRLGPPGAVEVFTWGKNDENLNIGQAIPRSIETEGLLAPHLCKCMNKESGKSEATINGVKYTSLFGTFAKPAESQIPCTADTDYPGIQYENYPPDTLLKVELTVKLTITVTCDGTDGSHAEDTIQVNYSGRIPDFTTPKR